MDKAKHAFGSSAAIDEALQSGKINARDVLFLDENTDNPKVGWITKSGEVVIAKPDLSSVEAELATKANSEDVETLEGQLATKADASKVEALQTEVATKVDAATVQTMINDATIGVIEVIEF